MNTGEIESRRSRLSRSYYLASSNRSRKLGYGTPKELDSAWKRLVAMVEYQFLPHYFSAVPSWRLNLRKLGGARTLPDFCVIGPIKSGTSDLAVSLMLHPNVITPLAKEFRISRPESWPVYYPTCREKNRRIIRDGIALAPYLAPFIHSMELITNLSRVRRDAKIILPLRNPTERLYSHWKWEVFLTGKERAQSLPFLSSFPAFVDRSLAAYPEQSMYTACGRPALQDSIYWKDVASWIEAFGRDNVLVLDIGDYFRDRSEFLRGVQKFVGLPIVDVPCSNNKINENPVNLPPPDGETQLKLNAFFKPHNEKLSSIIGKNFGW